MTLAPNPEAILCDDNSIFFLSFSDYMKQRLFKIDHTKFWINIQRDVKNLSYDY